MCDIKRVVLSLLLVHVLIIFTIVDVSASSGGTLDSFTLESGKGYVYSDNTKLPTPNSGSGYFFYKYADGKAWYSADYSVALSFCNKKGLTIKPSSVSDVFSGLWDYLVTNSNSGGNYKVYKGENVVGIALNDISGCQLTNHGGSGGSYGNNIVEVPSDIANLIYVFVQNKVAIEKPDYIQVPVISEHSFTGLPQRSSYINVNNKILNDYDNIGFCFKFTSNEYFIADNHYVRYFYVFDALSDGKFFESSDVSVYDSYVNFYGLNQAKNYVTIDDWVSNDFNGNFYLNAYDANKSLIALSNKRYNYDYSSSSITLANTYNENSFPYSVSTNYGGTVPISNNGPLTVYRSLNTPNQIENNTYAPNYRISKTWNNYDSTSSSNNTNITVNQIDNSSSTNETVYNESNTEINNETVENNYSYNIDNSSTIINNIVNNYYDTPSDGGDSGDGGGDSDSPIWDTLLQAIVDFFRKIGELIAALIAGILSALNSVLDAIANITTNFDGINNFLSSIFGFLPDEIVSVILLGVSMAVLISLIKLLRK